MADNVVNNRIFFVPVTGNELSSYNWAKCSTGLRTYANIAISKSAGRTRKISNRVHFHRGITQNIESKSCTFRADPPPRTATK